jgi:hypothetical protein
MMSAVTVYENGAVDWSGIHVPGRVWATLSGKNIEHLSVPTVLAAVLEDIHFIRNRLWKPEAVYIQRDLFHKMRNYWPARRDKTIEHRYRAGKRIWYIDGVQVRFSTGRRDYYVYCGNGKEIGYPN